MRALVLLLGCVLLLAAMQSSYVVVQARRERKADASPPANVPPAPPKDGSEAAGEGAGHGKKGHHDNHHGKEAGSHGDKGHHYSVKMEEGLSSHHKTDRTHGKGKDGHHHHHHKTSDHKADHPAAPPGGPQKHLEGKPEVHHRELDGGLKDLPGTTQQGEPLQVHISVERITHHDNHVNKQKQPYHLYDHMLGDSPHTDSHKGSHKQNRTHGSKKGKSHKGTNHGKGGKRGGGKSKGDKEEEAEGKRIMEHKTKEGHMCEYDADCKLGECCLQSRGGHKVCKRGSYKSVGRHCVSSCVCKHGLECIQRHTRRPSRQERTTDPAELFLGRCKPAHSAHASPTPSLGPALTK